MSNSEKDGFSLANSLRYSVELCCLKPRLLFFEVFIGCCSNHSNEPLEVKMSISYGKLWTQLRSPKKQKLWKVKELEIVYGIEVIKLDAASRHTLSEASIMSNFNVFHLLPVYQYYAAQPERFLYSVNPNIKDGWKQGPVAFYGHESLAQDIVPVYRFVATYPYYRYQYSVQPTIAGPGWKNEGVAFYAADKQRRRNYVPVYQYYAVENGNWRYQYSLDGTLGRGWIREKIAFYVPPFPFPVGCAPRIYDMRCGLV